MNKDTTKSIAVVFIIGIVAVIGGMIIYNKYLAQNFSIGQNVVGRPITLIGDSTDYKRVPQSYVFANTTTTDAVYDGAYTIQAVQTNYANKITVNIGAIGDVSTSTLHFRYQISDDDSNYFDVTNASTTDNILRTLATTTIDSFPRTDSVLIGAASTTRSISVNIAPAKYTRFIILGDKAGHLNTGVQAWVRIVLGDNLY